MDLQWDHLNYTAVSKIIISPFVKQWLHRYGYNNKMSILYSYLRSVQPRCPLDEVMEGMCILREYTRNSYRKTFSKRFIVLIVVFSYRTFCVSSIVLGLPAKIDRHQRAPRRGDNDRSEKCHWRLVTRYRYQSLDLFRSVMAS
jgi:hypothetical protein